MRTGSKPKQKEDTWCLLLSHKFKLTPLTCHLLVRCIWCLICVFCRLLPRSSILVWFIALLQLVGWWVVDASWILRLAAWDETLGQLMKPKCSLRKCTGHYWSTPFIMKQWNKICGEYIVMSVSVGQELQTRKVGITSITFTMAWFPWSWKNQAELSDPTGLPGPGFTLTQACCKEAAW